MGKGNKLTTERPKTGSSLAIQHLLLAAGDHSHLLSSVEEASSSVTKDSVTDMKETDRVCLCMYRWLALGC